MSELKPGKLFKLFQIDFYGSSTFAIAYTEDLRNHKEFVAMRIPNDTVLMYIKSYTCTDIVNEWDAVGECFNPIETDFRYHVYLCGDQLIAINGEDAPIVMYELEET